MGAFLYFCSHKNRPPKMRYFWLFQLAAFAMSMVWVYMLSGIIVDLIELVAILTGMSSALLGLTIMSWGNSIGDAFASCTMSIKGFGEMAITGCIAGPVFNLMIGLGIITLRSNLQNPEGIVFDIANRQNISSFLTILTTLLILMIFIWMIVMNDYKARPKDAKIIMAIYLIAIATIAAFST